MTIPLDGIKGSSPESRRLGHWSKRNTSTAFADIRLRYSSWPSSTPYLGSWPLASAPFPVIILLAILLLLLFF
jgi:hypothetical protein